MDMKELVEKARHELLAELSIFAGDNDILPKPQVRFYRPSSGAVVIDDKGVGKLNDLIENVGGPSVYGWEGPHKTKTLGLTVSDNEGWLRRWINKLGMVSITELPLTMVEIIVQQDYHGYIASADRFRVVSVALDTRLRNFNTEIPTRDCVSTTNIEFGIEWAGYLDDEDRLNKIVNENPTIGNLEDLLSSNNEMVREFAKLSTGVDGFPIKHRFQIIEAISRRQDVTNMIEKIVADHRG